MHIVEILEAERAITRVLTRYAHANDRHDWDGVRACFHPDAQDDHLDYKGGVDGLISWLQLRHEPLLHSVHHLGNILIDIQAPDRASSETYCIVLQRYVEHDAVHDVFIHSRYVDEHERRDGGPWKIAKRCVVYGLSRVEPVKTGFEDGGGEGWLRAQFGPADPVFALPGFAWSVPDADEPAPRGRT